MRHNRYNPFHSSLPAAAKYAVTAKNSVSCITVTTVARNYQGSFSFNSVSPRCVLGLTPLLPVMGAYYITDVWEV